VAAARTVRDALEDLLRWFLYWHWRATSNVGSTSVDVSATATVIIPTYAPERLRNLAPLVGHALRCSFVRKVVVSANNPAIDVSRSVPSDVRVVILHPPERRGSGICWEIAAAEEGEYFLVVDDDLLAYRNQLAVLFRALVNDPWRPHGLCGEKADRYVVGRRSVVDNLFSIYAVTRQHIDTYLGYVQAMVAAGEVSAETMDLWADDVVLSRSGQEPPMVHDSGYLLHCRSSTLARVALFKQAGFDDQRRQALSSLERLQASEGARR
jgi:hypothetical protein